MQDLGLTRSIQPLFALKTQPDWLKDTGLPYCIMPLEVLVGQQALAGSRDKMNVNGLDYPVMTMTAPVMHSFPITEINLNENNVVGELPPEIYGLVEITNLFMQKNSISGSIPSEIINLSKLAKLDLDTNELSGSLPSEFYELGQLDTIDLNNNNLNGPLTDAIGNLLQLSILQLENNNFSGPVPATGLLRLEKLCE